MGLNSIDWYSERYFNMVYPIYIWFYYDSIYGLNMGLNIYSVPSGKLSHNYGKSPCYHWESPLFLWPCSIATQQITRGYLKAFKNSERYFLGKLYHNNYHSYGIDGIAMEMEHIYFDGFPLRFFDLQIGALPMAKERRFSQPRLMTPESIAMAADLFSGATQSKYSAST